MQLIENILSTTKIYLFENLHAEDIYRIIIYTSGKNSPEILFLHDPSVKAVEEFIDLLSSKFELTTYSKISSDPPVQQIDRIAEIILKKNIDLVWAVGGGSTMDTAKAASVVAATGGSLEEYLGNNPTRIPDGKKVPVICSPTTAGTGAEATKFGVYTSNSGRKYTLASQFLQPDIAVLFPQFTYSMPPSVTASTAFDALTHAIEPLWNKNATPITDHIAIDTAVRILNKMEKAYDSSIAGEIKGRKEMLIAATLAGITFNLTGTAAIHALSFPLSEVWHVPHGAACAFFFEDVWNINIQNNNVSKKLKKVATKLNLKTEEELFNRIVQIKKKMKLSSKFSDIQIQFNPEDQMDHFYDTLNDPKMKNNVIPLSKEDIKTLILHKN